MKEFVLETTIDKKEYQPSATGTDNLKASKQALRLTEQQLRDERRTIREQRKIEDKAWKQLKTQRKKQKEKQQPKSSSQTHKKKTLDSQWKAIRQQL